jgi:tRNA G18 (ribose-2'-O)-methylase SpoU
MTNAPLTIDAINRMVENKEIDTRNILDEFKGQPHDDIVQAHKERQTDGVAIAINMTHDFNKGTVLRTFAGFAGKAFYFLNKPNNMSDSPEGTKKWDKRGAVGVQNYVEVENYDIRRYLELFDKLRADGYTIYAVDNIESFNPEPYYNVEFPKKACFVVGEEGPGIPAEVIEACDAMVYIPMQGVTPRSFNVATAFAIVYGDYMRQNYPVR